MRIDLGAKVQTKDGDGAGRIKQAIWDPRANKVTAYVIDTGGLLGHQVVVSPETVEGATRDGDAIVLDMKKPELDELARYEEADYEAAPVGWAPPPGFGRPSAGFLWPIGDVERSPVVPPPPQQRERPGAKIKEGMRVRDANGDEIGSVDEVLVDGSAEELRGIVVKRGGAFARASAAEEKIEIGVEHIGAVDDEVRLITSEPETSRREHA